MSSPLVSITSAFYNEEADLLNMVQSIFAQTFTNWELILIDDGSTDNSLAVAKSIDDPRVRVYSNGKNEGRSYSLNRLTELAKGKYIARMDADDICSPTRIQKQVDLIESDPDIDVVGTGMCYLDRNDNPLGCHYPKSSHEEICSDPNRTFGISHGSLLGKRTWFEKNNYDESLILAIDFNLFTRSYKTSKFANVIEPLYYYRLDQSFTLNQQWTARNASAKFLYENNKKAGRYGQALASWLVQYGKFAVTVFMFAVGLRDKLMARRYDALTDEDRKSRLQEIEAIKNIKIPLKNIEGVKE